MAGLESGRFLQARRLHQWKKSFGEDYRLRPMIPARLARGDAVADFFDTVCGSLPDDWSPPRPTNEALSASGLAQVARLQKLLTDAPASLRHALGYEFARLYVRATKGSPAGKIGLGADLAERLRDAFLDDARRLDEDFFDGEDLFVPALQSGVRKALGGNDRPLEIPADAAGQEIIAKLMKMVRSSSDQVGLARRLRKARYKRYLRAARRS